MKEHIGGYIAYRLFPIELRSKCCWWLKLKESSKYTQGRRGRARRLPPPQKRKQLRAIIVLPLNKKSHISVSHILWRKKMPNIALWLHVVWLPDIWKIFSVHRWKSVWIFSYFSLRVMIDSQSDIHQLEVFISQLRTLYDLDRSQVVLH